MTTDGDQLGLPAPPPVDPIDPAFDPARGWYRVPRGFLEHPLIRSMPAASRFVAELVCFGLPSFRDSEPWVNGARVPVPRGAFLHSERAIAELAGCDRKVVRTVLAKLERASFITRCAVGPSRGPSGGQPVHLTTVRFYAASQAEQSPPGPVTGPAVGQPGAQEGPSRGPVRMKETKETKGRTSSARAARGAGDPRHRPLLDRLCRVFAELSGGVRYGVAGKDLSAVTELLKLADEAEIERRWRAALTAPPGWYRSDSIAAFLSKWNSYASGAAPRDLKRGRVGAEDIPPEAFKEVGRVENF